MQSDFYWLAGLLEGEGYFFARKQNGQQSKFYSYGVTVTTTDQDVAERAARIMGGQVHGPYDYRGHKPIWRATIARRDEALNLMKEIYPQMSARRQQKIDEIFAVANAHPPVLRRAA